MAESRHPDLGSAHREAVLPAVLRKVHEENRRSYKCGRKFPDYLRPYRNRHLALPERLRRIADNRRAESSTRAALASEGPNRLD